MRAIKWIEPATEKYVTCSRKKLILCSTSYCRPTCAHEVLELPLEKCKAKAGPFLTLPGTQATKRKG
jgi:hypothetical protein